MEARLLTNDRSLLHTGISEEELSGTPNAMPNTGLGSRVSTLPGAIVGEGATLHPVNRVSRHNTI